MRVKGAFRSPPTFRPDSEKTWDSCRITLHTPPAFPASSAPENPRRPPLWGKKGAFSPASPAETRFFCPPPAIFPPEHPAVRPGPARFPPGARPGPAARAKPGAPAAARVCEIFRPKPPAFPAETPPAPASPPFFARKPAETRPPSPARSPAWVAPAANAARRRPNAPAKAHPRAGQPRLPWSAFPLRRGEVCDPKGGSDPCA